MGKRKHTLPKRLFEFASAFSDTAPPGPMNHHKVFCTVSQPIESLPALANRINDLFCVPRLFKTHLSSARRSLSTLARMLKLVAESGNRTDFPIARLPFSIPCHLSCLAGSMAAAAAAVVSLYPLFALLLLGHSPN